MGQDVQIGLFLIHGIPFSLCSSSCGVVNIYSQDSCLQETNPKPIKAIMNLVTGVSSLAFNPTTEILAIASEKMKEAVRLVIFLYPFLLSLVTLKVKKHAKITGKEECWIIFKSTIFFGL